MRIALIGIFLLSVLFLVRPAYSNTENNVLVRIVYDQSESMLKNPAANWSKTGADFFRNYFNHYSLRCQIVTIDYVAWGTNAYPPIQRRLSSYQQSNDLAKMLYVMSGANLEGTNPRDAMLHANNFVPDGYDRAIIIFVTDVDFVGEKHSGLGALVSKRTQFFGISLGGNASYEYMSRHLIPKHGQHFHANTTKEFNKSMSGILDEIGYEHCMAS